MTATALVGRDVVVLVGQREKGHTGEVVGGSDALRKWMELLIEKEA